MGWDIIGDIVGDIFGTATQVLIEDWWRDPKKRWIAISLLAAFIILLIAGIIYGFS